MAVEHDAPRDDSPPEEPETPAQQPEDNGTEGGVSFTHPSLDRELKPGDTLSDTDAQKIADASNGQLKFENGVLSGSNPDGTGDVHIEVGQPLTEGQIHDLHHTVAGSGGGGNSNNEGHGGHAPMNGTA